MDIPTCIILIVYAFLLGTGAGRLHEAKKYLDDGKEEHWSIRRQGHIDMLCQLAADIRDKLP